MEFKQSKEMQSPNQGNIWWRGPGIGLMYFKSPLLEIRIDYRDRGGWKVLLTVSGLNPALRNNEKHGGWELGRG